MDNYSGDVEIANVLGSKLQGLLSSNNEDASFLTLHSNFKSSPSSNDLSSIIVSPNTVSEALVHLKLNKSDGTQLASNHFIYAATPLSKPLSKLFTAMLQHGYVPESLRDCVLQPIVKIHLIQTVIGPLPWLPL